MKRVEFILAMVLASTLLLLAGGAQASDTLRLSSNDYYAADTPPMDEPPGEGQAESEDCD